MDHSATMRRMYDLLNAGDVDGFGDALADDLVDHEVQQLGAVPDGPPV